jgi:hypothetical protein
MPEAPARSGDRARRARRAREGAGSHSDPAHEVVGLGEPDVHALCAERARSMRGIAREPHTLIGAPKLSSSSSPHRARTDDQDLGGACGRCRSHAWPKRNPVPNSKKRTSGRAAANCRQKPISATPIAQIVRLSQPARAKPAQVPPGQPQARPDWSWQRRPTPDALCP